MNDTSLNSELLSADARGRKHIPFAVFAVILIHVLLFLVLLVAAGCRAKARAKQRIEAAPEMVKQEQAPSVTPVILMTNAALPNVSASEPVVAEPVVEKTEAQTTGKAAREVTAHRPTASTSMGEKFYVVQAGDTVEKIAKRHRTTIEAIKTENKLKNNLIHPGQKLRVGAENTKRSNEV